MVEIGEPRNIGRAYHKLNFGHLPHEAPTEELASSGTVIAEAWFQAANGERVTSAKPGGAPEHVLRGPHRGGPDRSRVAATLRTELGHTIIVARSDQHGQRSGSFKAGETVIARFDLPNWLTSSRYAMTPSLAREGTGEDALALVEDMASILIHGDASGGILELPIDVKIERT